jgi:hypothetical protein
MKEERIDGEDEEGSDEEKGFERHQQEIAPKSGEANREETGRGETKSGS